MAGLQEDFDSAIVIENRWIADGLQVHKPKYNVLLSYPDDNNPNRFDRIHHTSTLTCLVSHLLVSLLQ